MKARKGFTLFEICIVIGAFVLITAVLAPVVKLTQERAARIACANNLRLISLGLHGYAADHEGRFPGTLSELYPTYVTNDTTFDCSGSATIGRPEAGDYEYVPGLTEASSPTETIVYDKDGDHGRAGKNIARLSGVVAWVRTSAGKPR